MKFINLTCKIAQWTCSSVIGSNEPSKPIRIKKIHSHLITTYDILQQSMTYITATYDILQQSMTYITATYDI